MRISQISCSNQESTGGGLTDADPQIWCMGRTRRSYSPLGGRYDFGDDSYLIIATADDLGIKGDLAFETGIYKTIGSDLVAMVVNDIVTAGAKPVRFDVTFYDYSARNRLFVEIKKKEREAAEMPYYFLEGNYLFGCIARGVVKRDSYIDGKNIVAGDVLIGLPSGGVHSNGFSLINRILSQSGISLEDQLPGCSGKPISLGEALMAPTVIYVKQVLNIFSKGGVKGLAHIAVGGFHNMRQMFPKGLGATINKDAWEVPAIFNWIEEAGRLEDVDMWRTFNMGIGMVLVVSPDASARILAEQDGGYSAYHIGEVTNKEGLTYQ